MKSIFLKYGPVAYLVCVWLVLELCADEKKGAVFAGGFLIAVFLFIVIKNKIVSGVAVMSICVGLSIFNIAFLFRVVPPLMLLTGHLREEKENVPNKKNHTGNTYVFTALLVAVSASIAGMFYDIGCGCADVDMHQYTWTSAAVLIFLLLVCRETIAPRKNTSDAGRRGAAGMRKSLFYMHTGGLICFMEPVVVMFMNPGLYNSPFMLYPWIVYAVFVSGGHDPAVQAAEARVRNRMRRLFTETSANGASG
ncbi:MAG: hypothetical protein IJR51_02035 [Clostridia bacterium]|nr:hypothetical protein [Clostridia bacterium]